MSLTTEWLSTNNNPILQSHEDGDKDSPSINNIFSITEIYKETGKYFSFKECVKLCWVSKILKTAVEEAGVFKLAKNIFFGGCPVFRISQSARYESSLNEEILRNLARIELANLFLSTKSLITELEINSFINKNDCLQNAFAAKLKLSRLELTTFDDIEKAATYYHEYKKGDPSAPNLWKEFFNELLYQGLLVNPF